MLGRLLNFIFPPICIGCGKMGKSICEKCIKEFMPTQRDTCPYCFFNSKYGKTHDRCFKNNSLNGALSVLVYNKIAKKLISQIKYRMAYQYFFDVFDLLPNFWFDKFIEFTKLENDWVFQPIPLHKKRQNLRGFNQSKIISDYFSQITGLKSTEILIKVKDTIPQAKVSSKKARKENVEGVFLVKKNTIIPKRIILVDDVYTSANTAIEAAKTLKKSGCQEVYLFTLAHGR